MFRYLFSFEPLVFCTCYLNACSTFPLQEFDNDAETLISNLAVTAEDDDLDICKHFSFFFFSFLRIGYRYIIIIIIIM